MPKAKAAAARAIELDIASQKRTPRSVTSNSRLTGNWPPPSGSSTAPLRLNPSLPRAHAGYAHYLLVLRRTDEAIQELDRVQKIDPLFRSLTWGCRGCSSLLSAIRQPLKRPNKRRRSRPCAFLCGVGPTAGSHCRCGPRGEIHTESHHLGTGRVCVCHGRQAGEGSGDARRDRGTGAAALHLRVQRGMRIRLLGRQGERLRLARASLSRPFGLNAPRRGGSRLDRLRGDPRFADLLRRIGLSP